MPSDGSLSKVNRVWNQFDEFALLQSTDRAPGETNNHLRNRMINHDPYNSTKQGLTNWVSDALLDTTHNVVDKTVFSSLFIPMTNLQFQTENQSDLTYFQPRIIIGSTTWIIPTSSDKERDSVTVNGITWSLWKEVPDENYINIWTTDSMPTEDIEIRYQWRDPLSLIFYTIKESPKRLLWSNGTIVEENPDE